MGIAERKERHRDDLKKDILHAAMDLFLERGLEATSIRNIAEKVEYAPATLYLYYKDKNEIVHALHQEGFKKMIVSFQSLGNISAPFERLKAMGQAYIQFAMENKELYKLMFVWEEPLKHVESCAVPDWDEGDQAFDILVQTVGACQAKGYFNGLETGPLSLLIWSTMHGLCTLATSGHLDHVAATKIGGQEPNQVMKHTYKTFVELLERLQA